jgi:conjugative relaxase-like TrwC/TraI family protein
MLKITQITAAQAKNYYAKDDHYYAKTETTSEWAGELAADLNLAGGVDGRIFEAMLTGELPNGIVLPGKGNQQEQRRAGFDATFSAPKSVSIAALLNDERLIEVHQQAVKTALKVAETRYAQDREWNRETKVVEVKQTGNLAIALFLHDTSRDLDPNLHTHAVILNGTKDAKGNYRALYTEELYGHRKLLDDIYLNELAHGARQLGYEIEPTTDGFELAGYTRELRDTFSQRRKTIEMHVAEQIENGAVAAGKLYQQAALATRTQKREVNHETLIDKWAEVLTVKGLTLPATPVVHPQNDLIIGGQMQAIVAAHDGINHAEERESVFRRGKVERFALEHHVGLQSWRQLQTAIVNTNQLIQVDAIRDKCTTQMAIIRERETIALMKQGQGAFAEIATLDRMAEKIPDSLTTGQRAALELGITTNDQIIAWQGVAGAGKTYALNLYRQIATEAGYTVRGFAPSAAAAAVLGAEAEMPSDTVASLLYLKQPDADTPKNR